MTNAAFFLVTRSMRNRFVRSVARLRQPRYVLGALMAAAYFWTFFVRKGAMRGAGPSLRGMPYIETMTLILTVIAFVVMAVAWALPANGPGLVFREAEIQFFFAGPVSRRQLLAYKALRSQLQSSFSAVMISFFAFKGSHLFGVWISFAVLDVYLTFASFARARLKLAGIGWIWRAVAVSVALTLVATAADRQFRASSGLLTSALQQPKKAALVRAVTTIVAQQPLATILYVPRLFASTAYAPDPLLPTTVVLLFGFMLFFLTTQLDVSFEDASLIASQRSLTRRARMQGMRAGRSSAVNRFPPLFKLAPTGRPEIALMWKNLIGTMRISSFPFMAIILPLVLAGVAAVFRHTPHVVVAMGMMCLMSTAAFVFLGPQAVRTDLRTDILRLDIIKAFPISAEALITGELAASLVVISVVEFVTLIGGVALLQFSGRMVFFTTPEFIVSALVFIIPITAIQLLVQNGAIVLFPAWNLSSDGGRFSAIGQRLVLMLGNIITLAIALVPAALLFAPSFWLAHKYMPSAPIGTLIAAIPAAAVLVAEIFVAHRFLAAQFEEIDIANDVDSVTQE